MTNFSQDFAPFFRNGRLFLPEKTVNLLIDSGLDTQTAQAALNGLDIIEQRELIGRLNRALEMALETLEESTQEFRALNSSETRFLLTGKRGVAV